MLEKIKERIVKMSRLEKVLSLIVIMFVIFIIYCVATGDDYTEEDMTVDNHTDIKEEYNNQEQDELDNILAADSYVENYIKEKMPGYDVLFRRNDSLVSITISAPDVDASSMPQSVIDETVRVYELDYYADLLADNVEEYYKESGKEVYCTVSLYDINGILLYESK